MAELAKALVVTADPSPTYGTGNETPVTMTPEGRLRVDAALSVGDVELTIAEYTEDAVAAANPTGPVVMLVREDARAGSLTNTDGDNVAQRGNNKGEAYTIDTDANAVLGTTAGAKVITDATGTIQQYMRGLVSQWVASTLTFASRGYSASATFTPAASSHTAGDSNGTAQTFATIGPSAGRVKILGASLLINNATIETTAWQLHLFDVTPPSALADDAAFVLAAGDQASYLGYLDLAQVVDVGSTLYIQTNNIFKPVKLASTSLFAYLVNTTTLTPGNVAHIVTLHTEAY